MKHHFFAVLFVSQMLAQNTDLCAQATKIEGTNIEFTLPNATWKLALSDKNPKSAMYAYQSESKDGDNSKASVSVIIDNLPEHKRVSEYAFEKMRVAKITKMHFFDFRESKKFGLINGMLFKGYSGGDTVYFGSAVNGLKAFMILCSAKGKSFEKYDAEFLSLLASLTYTFAPDKVSNTSKTSNATNGGTSKTVTTEKGSINSCNYFPVVNRMKFAYKRTDMAGEHTIAETYTVANDKTLSSGKIIKGYKINTTVANRNNTVIYYYCDNGSVKMYSEMPSYNTHIKSYVEDYSVLPSDYNKADYKKTPIWETEKSGSGKYLNFTELKSGNTGTQWTDIQVVNGNPVIITSEIVETGLTLTVQGKSYSPVIHVERSVTIKFQGEDRLLNSQDIYYAKDIGKIKVVEEGDDILMGSFTTTQELVSYNIPAGR